MPLENLDTIDIVMRPTPDKLKLVITDAGVTTDVDERMALFVGKLRTYVGYIMSQEFKNEYPTLRPADVTICLVTRNPPSEQMTAITHVTPKGDPASRIAVQFEMFHGADGLIESVDQEESEPAIEKKRPWWKVWN